MSQSRVILLIEDSEDDALLLGHCFAEAEVPWSVQVVPNAQEAVAYLAGEGHYSNRKLYPFPALVLMDLVTGSKDAFDVLRWARDHDLRRRTVIVILSGIESPATIKRAYDLGANSYLVKPCSLENLTALTRRIKEYWVELNHLP